MLAQGFMVRRETPGKLPFQLPRSCRTLDFGKKWGQNTAPSSVLSRGPGSTGPQVTSPWTSCFAEKRQSHSPGGSQNHGSHVHLSAPRPEFSLPPHTFWGCGWIYDPADWSSHQHVARACSAQHCQEQGTNCPLTSTNETPGSVGQRHLAKVLEPRFSQIPSSYPLKVLLPGLWVKKERKGCGLDMMGTSG
ncbi:uncharacterized protein LOC123599850 isoform X3 [Leopardus geoffroyi]|nr:uncharacterized protein LOC123599850 isoform X3 [Leopardus geoffroyi]